MPDLKFSTSANLQGFHDLESALDKLHAHVKTVAADMQRLGVSQSQTGAGALSSGGGVLDYGSPSPGTPRPREAAPGLSAPPGGRSMRPRRGAKPSGQYDLNTISGLESWDQNVYAPAQTVLQMMDKGQSPTQSKSASRASSSRSRAASVPGMVPLLGSNFKSRNMPGSTPYYEDWFNRIGQPDVQSMLPSNLQESYQEALGMYVGGHKNVAADFYQNYASEANQPSITGATTPSFFARFKQHAKGTSAGALITSGLRGAFMGASETAVSGASVLTGGGGGGGSIMAGDMGMLADIAPPAIAAALFGEVLKSGYQNWEKTSPTSSQLAHSLDTVGQGANVLNLSIQKAASAFGIAGAAALNSASTLAQAFGGNNATVSSLTGQAAEFAMYNGLSDQTQTNLMSSFGTLGITSGTGSTLTPWEGNQMLTNLTTQSHMQGRQGPLYTGLTSIYSGLGSVNPVISNPLGVAGQYAALNATGIQGLQGTRGAQLMATMNASLASGSGMSQMLGMAAIYQASGGKITNPFEMQSILEQGTAAKVGNTTVGAQMAKMVGEMSSNKYTQAGIFSSAMGTSVNQSMSILGSHAMNAKSLSVPQGALGLHLTLADRHAIAAAEAGYQSAKYGQAAGSVATFFDQVGGGLLKSVSGIGNFFYHAPGDISQLAHSQINMVQTVLNAGHAGTGSLYPYAEQVSKKTGIPAADILGQWIHESAWGQSTAAVQNHNLAGIKPSLAYPHGADAKYAGFANLEQFAQADAETLNQPRYKHARVLAEHGASAQAIFSALASEGYTGHPTQAQANAYGGDVQAIVDGFAGALKQALAEYRQARNVDQQREQHKRQSGPHR